MGSTSYAGLPYPGLPDSPNVPSDVQALADRMDTLLSLLVGGGSTIPDTALNLSNVPGQITTLNNTQSSQGTTLNTLNNRPYIQQLYYQKHDTSDSIASSKFTDQTVQTLSISSSTPWLRLGIFYMTSCWGWQAASTNTLRSKLLINGTERTEVMQSGTNVTLSAWYAMQIAAGATATVTQTINCYHANQTLSAVTQEISPLIIAVLIPWYGVAESPPTAL